MDKELFLKELSERLQVLNEKERQDLLDEYAQHIDMKIKNGMSEEDAVKDFGTLDELCAELLDVYHINSEYASGSAARVQKEEAGNAESNSAAQNVRKKLLEGIPIPGIKKDMVSSAEKTEEQIAQELEEKRLREERRALAVQMKEERRLKFEEWKKERRVRSAKKREERTVKAAKWREEYGVKYSEQKEARRVRRQEKRALRKEKCAQMHEAYQQRKLERQAYRAANGGSWLMRFCTGAWHLMVFLCVLFWKSCLFCAALPVLFLGLCALFCTGTVAVLLQQGYPLAGAALIGAGVFLASAGVSGLILSYVFTGKRSREE